jgi:multiple sugar transport system substrate-binding protein
MSNLTKTVCFILFISSQLFLCSNQEKKLTFWIGGAPQEVDYWEKLVQKFEVQSGYDVSVIRQPTDSDQRRQGLVISLQSRQPDPDLFLMDVIWIGQFAQSHWLEPLDGFIQQYQFSIEPFFQRVIRLVDRYDAKLFALPVYVDGGLLYYRQDLLQQFGYTKPPKTWGQLLEMSQKIQPRMLEQNSNFYGFVWQGAQYEGLVCTFLEFISSNSGGIMMDNKIKLNRTNNFAALQFMQDLIHKYRISPPNTYTEMKEEQVRRWFQRGNALFERNWPYAWELHQSKDSSVKGKIGISPLPHFVGGESASTLGGWHIGISRFSDQKEKAWQLLQFITSYKSQKELVLNLGWNPGRSDVYADEEVLKKLPHLLRLRSVFEHAVARPDLPYYTQISETIQRYVNRCLAGKMSPEDALNRAQIEIDEITKIYGQK